MKNGWIVILTAFIALVFVMDTRAQNVPNAPVYIAKDPKFYYEINGAYPIARGSSTLIDLSFGLDGRINFGYSCGKFNLRETLSNAFDNLEEEVAELEETIIGAANGFIASLPMYILQRINPDIANLIKNYKFEIEEKFALAVKSCEQLEAQMRKDGGQAFSDWVTFGKNNTMAEASEEAGGDAIAVTRTVNEDTGEDGVPWGGENAGGEDQDPIRLNRDVTLFGYNSLLGRDLRQETEASDVLRQNARIAQVFEEPQELTDFVTDIIGDTEFYIYEERPEKEFKPGRGLPAVIETTSDSIVESLREYVGLGLLPYDNIPEISAPGIAITPELIDSIRSLPLEHREVVMLRLADEIAAAQTIDRALLALRAMRAGHGTPDVKGSPAYEQFKNSIDEMLEEIKWIQFEHDMRSKLVTDTALKTYVKAQTLNNAVNTPFTNTPSRELYLPGGAIGEDVRPGN